MPTPTLAQLQQAMTLAEQIEQLQAQLAGLVGGSSSVASAPSVSTASPAKKKGKRKLSPETIAKMKASQQARWAKKNVTILDVISPLDTLSKAQKAKAAKPAKKAKRKLSPEGRARIVAALKKRWAAKKRAGK